MKLTDIFKHGITHADNLIFLYDSLLTKNERFAKTQWIQKIYRSKIVYWPKKDGLWRSNGKNILIIGNNKALLSHRSFQSDSLVLLLRSALILAMATVDKILHEAIMKHFASLLKAGQLDRMISLPISDTYNVAIKSRKRRGKGGKIQSRPSHFIKELFMDELYRNSFLSTRKLQEVSSMCGKNKIFAKFSKTSGLSTKVSVLQNRWSAIYQKRNHIAHECDMVRKESTKKVSFNSHDPRTLVDDIDFVKKFGNFLAQTLN